MLSSKVGLTFLWHYIPILGWNKVLYSFCIQQYDIKLDISYGLGFPIIVMTGSMNISAVFPQKYWCHVSLSSKIEFEFVKISLEICKGGLSKVVKVNKLFLWHLALENVLLDRFFSLFLRTLLLNKPWWFNGELTWILFLIKLNFTCLLTCSILRTLSLTIRLPWGLGSFRFFQWCLWMENLM